jgi:DNA-binding NarL/FixJ family response regulator
MSNPIAVLLVDDHAVVRAGYRMLLEQISHITVAGEAERGEAACQLYAEIAPDVVVMDLSLPGIGGLATIRRICSRDAAARILAFSIHDEAVYVNRALESGAKGYISKSCPGEMLVEAVQKVAAGEIYIEPTLLQKLAVQRVAHGSGSAALLNGLSAREFDVFCLLAQGYTTREVAEELRLGYKTAANYGTSIKHKLQLDTSAEMARLAYEWGVFKS